MPRSATPVLLLAGVLAPALALAPAVVAAELDVSNPSFEIPDVDPFQYQPDDGAAPRGGWDFSPGSGITDQQTVFAGDADGGTLASDGSQLAFLQQTTEIAQNVFDGTPGETYYVIFDAAGRADNGSEFGILSVEISDIGGGNSFVIFEPTPIPIGEEASVADPKVLATYQADFDLPVNFGSQFRVRFIHSSGQAPDTSTLLDNVRISTTPIPEPASMGLLAGAGALLLRRRR